MRGSAVTTVVPDADVVVVGLGPVGAVASLLLAQAGLDVVAVERNEGVFPLPRAAHVDHEVMRVFQQLGLVDAIAPAVRSAAPYEFRNAAGEALLRFEFDPAASPSGWAPGYMIHQPGIERALHADIASRAVRVLRGHVSGFAQDSEGVTVELDGGESVRGKYLIGCDGASSLVREAAGIGITDFAFDEPWLVIDALIERTDLLPELNLQICDPARPTTCVLMPAGRHRWEFMLLPGEDPASVVDPEFIANLLEPWGVNGHVEIERKAVYYFHGLIADRWRDRRVLLAGDAAHQMPPFAGQGFCSGVRDAANLAWKLAAVIRGRADEVILDTYQTERKPHVSALISLAIAMGRTVCLLDGEAVAQRDAAMRARRATGASGLPPLPPAMLGPGLLLAGSPVAGTIFPQPWVHSGTTVERLDDVLGGGAWLITRGPSGPAMANVVHTSIDTPELAPFREHLTRWLEAQGAEAVLVRPDRYVFGCGETARLKAAYAQALRGPVDVREMA